MIDPLDLPFDQYQRYRFVADLLAEVRPKNSRLSVLDVGGRTALLRSFLPDDRVVLVDLEVSEEPGLVLGDGSRLPFRDASFDVVAAFDTLEHVPPAARARFVSECRRVARRWVFLAGPYQSAEVEEAEKLLQRFLSDKLQVEHRYLEEHRHNGLPSRSETEAGLAASGARVASLGHGNLDRWLALICMSMYMDYTPELRGIASRFFRFYNHNLYASDGAEPVYRHAVVAGIGDAPLPRGMRHSDRASAGAPAGAMQTMTELAFELVDFDRARKEWRETWRRMTEVNRDVVRDLEGHRKTLERSRRIEVEQAEVIETLERDLAGHRDIKERLQHELHDANADRAALHAEIERLEARYAQFGRDHESVRAELETQIGEHKAVITALELDLDGHRVVLGELGAELERHKELATAQLAEIQELQGRLDRGAVLIAELRAELSGRWKSLKRALGPQRPPP